MSDEKVSKTLLSVEEAARSLDVSRTLMFRLIKDGHVKSVKIGRLRRVSIAALHEYADSLASAHNGASHSE